MNTILNTYLITFETFNTSSEMVSREREHVVSDNELNAVATLAQELILRSLKSKHYLAHHMNVISVLKLNV